MTFGGPRSSRGGDARSSHSARSGPNIVNGQDRDAAALAGHDKKGSSVLITNRSSSMSLEEL